MKIVHICLAGPFSEGYSYQENLLTKYHVRLGHEVSVITSTWALNNKGIMEEYTENEYTNEDQVKVFRIGMKGKNNYYKKIKKFRDYNKILVEIKPDIIFIHGTQFINVKPIIAYKQKNSEVKIYADNHADYSNSATNLLSKEILHKIIWRKIALKMEPYIDKFYGVLPARKKFLVDVYKIPEAKVGLLNMGGDDDLVQKYQENTPTNFKEQIGCKPHQTLLVTGGKIDDSKREVLLLMEYVKNKKNIFLVIFGSIEEQIKPSFDELLGDNIQHIGWITSEQSYEIFAASNLVVFPGRHSVYWEQVVSQQKPMVVKQWDGTNHIDIGGNVSFVDYSYSEKKLLFKELDDVLFTQKLERMTKAAQSDKSTAFLYSIIAKQSINKA